MLCLLSPWQMDYCDVCDNKNCELLAFLGSTRTIIITMLVWILGECSFCCRLYRYLQAVWIRRKDSESEIWASHAIVLEESKIRYCIWMILFSFISMFLKVKDNFIVSKLFQLFSSLLFFPTSSYQPFFLIMILSRV